MAYPQECHDDTVTREIAPAPGSFIYMPPYMSLPVPECVLPELRPSDPRLLVTETSRPRIPVAAATPNQPPNQPATPTDSQPATENQAALLQLLDLIRADPSRVENEELLIAQLRYVSETHPTIFQQLLSLLKTVNGAVVETSPTALACTASNTAFYFLGTARQARNAIYYLVKYLTKDRTALSDVVAAICDAKVEMVRYPSIAADAGQDERTGDMLSFRAFSFF